jgi:hypothetical protein
MRVPAVQFGDWPIVRKRMRSIVTRIKRGESIVAVMTEDGMIDVNEHPGMMMMGGTMLAGRENFHCFMPWLPLWQTLLDSRAKTPPPPGAMAAIFEESLTVSWGVLGLLSFENQMWIARPDRFQPFLNAVISVWDEFDTVGSRYVAGMQGESLWSIPNNLHYILANLGVPDDVLSGVLPPEGPRALLNMYASRTKDY